MRGETSIAERCRKEGIAQSIYYGWSKEFLEAGKRRLAGERPSEATMAHGSLVAEGTRMLGVKAEQTGQRPHRFIDFPDNNWWGAARIIETPG